MSWSPRLRIASDFLKAGDEVEAQILTLDREEKKMSLGLKQLVANPWENIREKYAVGSQHTATVRNITNFGVFAELEEGIEGLVHISDLSWNKIKHPSELVANPWENIREKYAVGTKHTATVRNITNFGVFAELEEGIEGLVHISDLSWNKIKHPSEMIAAGDSIEVVVLDFDEENHKLSLGHKQLLPNPWDEIEAKYAVGTVVEAKIASVNEKGAVVELEGDVDAFCFNRELAKEDGTMPVSGETLAFKVIELKRNAKKATLSHAKTYAAAVEERAQKAAAEVENTKKAVKKINSSVEKTTLGDLDALAALKSQLENK